MIDAREIIVRYDFLLILSLFQSTVLYELFTPLTLYPVLWIVKLFVSARILPLTATIETSSIIFSLVPACIAGSAYYLLMVLNLTTPMSLQQRWKSLLFIIGLFFSFNVFRIIFFVFLFSSGVSFAEPLHLVVWYCASIFLVVAIWFANVALFKIDSLPVIEDILELWSAANGQKDS